MSKEAPTEEQNLTSLNKVIERNIDKIEALKAEQQQLEVELKAKLAENEWARMDPYTGSYDEPERYREYTADWRSDYADSVGMPLYERIR